MNAPRYSLILALLLSSSILVGSQELTPLKQLELGQSVTQMLTGYATAKPVLEKRDRRSLVDGVFAVPITNNLYWSGAIVGIIGDHVASIAYIQSANFERAFSNAPIILRQLISLQGTNYIRAVARQHSKTGKVESPVLIWEKPDRVLAYSFMPLELYKEGEPFVCQLTLFPPGKKREEFFEIATLPDADKVRVFRSVDEILQNEAAPRP